MLVNPSMGIIPNNLSVLLLFILFAWSLFYVYKSNLGRRPVFIKRLNLLFVLFSIYGLIRFINNETYVIWLTGNGTKVGPREYLIAYWSSLLPIYAFYFFAKKGLITETNIKIWTIIFIAVSTITYFGEEANRLAMQVTPNEGITNNQGYKFVAIIPLLVFFRRETILQYLLLAYCLVFVVMGMKRGAIIIAMVCLAIFLWQTIKSYSSTKKILIFLLTAIFLYVGYSFLMWYIGTNDYFMSRLQDTVEGNSSGRDTIYKKAVDYLKYSINIFSLLFGLGADGTIKALGQVAHNDWLEIIIDTGIFGLILYILYWKSFYTSLRLSKRANNSLHLCMILLFAIFFLKSLFSMSINDIPIYCSLALGYCINSINKPSFPCYVKN